MKYKVVFKECTWISYIIMWINELLEWLEYNDYFYFSIIDNG